MTAWPRCRKCWTSVPGAPCYCWDGIVQDGDEHCPHCHGTSRCPVVAHPEPWGIEGARHAIAVRPRMDLVSTVRPDTHPETDVDNLRAELAACQQEIDRLRGLLTESERTADMWQQQAVRGDTQ